MGRVEGKVALVTGGAMGLGKAIAQMLAREGAQVVVTDVREEQGRQVAAQIGESALYVRLDVTKEADWIATTDRVVQQFGRLDIVVNNAGVGSALDIEQCSLEEWRRVMAVNLDGVFLGCKHAVRAMRQCSTKGSIINMSSIAGLVGVANYPAYNASKGGVRLLTKSVALHCARSGLGIRCNSVHPTYIDTPMVQGLLGLSPDAQKARQQLERQIPLGHLGEPDDVAYAVLYLASDESKLVTGAEFVIDGGSTAQ